MRHSVIAPQAPFARAVAGSTLRPPAMTLLEDLWTNWSVSLICTVVALSLPLLYFLARRTTKAPTFLDPTVFKHLPLIEKKVLSYNTRLFR